VYLEVDRKILFQAAVMTCIIYLGYEIEVCVQVKGFCLEILIIVITVLTPLSCSPMLLLIYFIIPDYLGLSDQIIHNAVLAAEVM
jgi:hypothetical protein